ncbi:MAG: hypothetical protein AVO39_08970 [delta proteobacterium MLS_D]|jgi:3',5'-nucleoside bisphosphate phosphatase|nr:MAG: hypothetical protein AVO39_08970 [delta proteobacterium MLS_D]
MSLRQLRCDLHIHSCLSPCAELDMYPRAIVARALEAGLDIIAISDHNASENTEYVIKAARGSRLTVFPGMEITSREEVHILSLFEKPEPLAALQEIVYRSLPGVNDEDAFGCQAVVNERDEVEFLSKRLLIGSTTLSIEEIVETVHGLGGAAIAAHIDRESFGIIGQLGFIPATVRFDALEVSRRAGVAAVRHMFPELEGYALISSSDAHRIEDIGRGSTIMMLEEPTLAECLMAFAGRGGRRILD